MITAAIIVSLCMWSAVPSDASIAWSSDTRPGHAVAAEPTPGCAFSGGALICGGVVPTEVPRPDRVAPDTPGVPTRTESASPTPESGVTTPFPRDPETPAEEPHDVLGAIGVVLASSAAAIWLAVHVWRRRAPDGP
jgi:hypothetical protein